MMGKNVTTFAVSLIILSFSGSAASDIILNGTSFYLSTGDSYGLSQGYLIKLKSVSSEGSVWLELESNDRIVKSEITHQKGYFVYNKTNRTIISIKVDNIYSGSINSDLVSFSPVYQYIDKDKPAPKIIEIRPEITPEQINDSKPALKQSIPEFVVLAAGMIIMILLFLMVQRFW